MPETVVSEPPVDRRRIRLGLALLVLVVVGALIAAAVLKDPTPRIVMLFIAGFTVVRAFLFTRSLRRRV